jgi:hypothetical protein
MNYEEWERSVQTDSDKPGSTVNWETLDTLLQNVPFP